VLAVLLKLTGGLQRPREDVPELGAAGAEAVERPGRDKLFDRGTRDELEVEALTEVEEVLETSTPRRRASSMCCTMMSRLLPSSISLDSSAAMNSGA
jgi:hypothetical protein